MSLLPNVLDRKIKVAHKSHKIRPATVAKSIDMDTANKAFDEYIKSLEDVSSSAELLDASLQRYKTARKTITKEILKDDAKQWDDVLKNNDARSFWRYVSWKGELRNKRHLKSPSLKEFEVFFEDLYKCKNQNELREMMMLDTDVYIPILDDPIDENEMKTAVKDMKKSGYDYNLPIIRILVTWYSLLIIQLDVLC